MTNVCFGVIATLLLGGTAAHAQKPPLLPEKDVAALANELNGETAKRNLEGIAQFHRQRGSQGFHAAAELVAERLKAYGLSDVAILQFSADGKIFYGTQRSRPAWDVEFAELWEPSRLDSPPCPQPSVEVQRQIEKEGGAIAVDCVIARPEKRVASYEAEPVVLAEDSESTEVTTNLVDVGEGTKESDYAGKQVKGNIVLVSAPPGAVQDLAVGTFGAAGIVSYAQNQKTAWWGEDENLIRWGHLETFSPNKTFAFMVSLKTARAFRERLAKGERVMLHAVVKAGQHPGNYEVVTATIPGADPKLKDEEIAFSCHLDHQRPGANDNASGCAAILEAARTLQKLINEGKLARPARSISFIFPPEIEGTMALLNRWGTGSDHDVYQDSSFGIPAIYLNDWPDRYIHTNFDSAANIDPTKLKRAAFIGAASGHFLANSQKEVSKSLYGRMLVSASQRFSRAAAMAEERNDEEGENYVREHVLYTVAVAHSLRRLLGLSEGAEGSLSEAITQFCGMKELRPSKKAVGLGLLVFRRSAAVKGPLAVFGYDYFAEHAKAVGVATTKLLSYEGLWGGGEEYAYEVLNFADGKRNAQEIRDAVSAEYGPVPLEMVVEYLKALEKIGIVEAVK